jgi:hypothetical protein
MENLKNVCTWYMHVLSFLYENLEQVITLSTYFTIMTDLIRQIFTSFGRWFQGTVEETKFTKKIAFRPEKIDLGEEDVNKTFGDWFRKQIGTYVPGSEFKLDFYVPGFTARPEAVFERAAEAKTTVRDIARARKMKTPVFDYGVKVRYFNGIPRPTIGRVRPYERSDGVEVSGHWRKNRGY